MRRNRTAGACSGGSDAAHLLRPVQREKEDRVQQNHDRFYDRSACDMLFQEN